MSAFLIIRLHAALLRLYPQSFRAEFAAEMQSVFAEAVAEAVGRDATSLIKVCLREIKDFPMSLLREYWHTLKTTGIGVDETRMPGSWWAATLAGLPHLLYALMIYAPVMIYELRTYGWDEIFAPFRHSERWDYTYPTQLIPAFWSLVAIMSAVGLWRGLPRWSASWLGYGLAGAWGAVIQFNSPDLTFAGVVMILAWLVLMVGGLLWLSRRDLLTGLLVVLPLVPMGSWLFAMEVVITDLEGLLYISAGLLIGLAAALAVRRGSFWFGVWVTAGVIVVMSLPINYSAAYYPSPAFPIAANPLSVMLSPLGDLLTFTLCGAPLWLLLAWRIGRRLPPSPRR